MADILAPFRRPGTVPAASPEPDEPPEPTRAAPLTEAVPEGYRAYSVAANGKPSRLDIRPARGLAIARAYSALSEIAYDQQGFTGILLLFVSGKLVTIHGRHLKPVVEALLAGTCEYLAELPEGEAAPQDGPAITHITTAGPKPPGGKPE